MSGARFPRRRWLAAILTGALAAAVVVVGTAPPGPGLDPDAESYLGAAISLVHSGTYRVPTSEWASIDSTEPLTHFPPGYPTLLAAPIAVGLSPLQAARVVDALAAFLTWTGIVALLMHAVSTRAAVLTAIAVLCTPAILTVHLSVLSEPAFFAALIAVVAGMWWMARTSSYRAALGTGLAAATAVLLRYAGVSLAIAAAWWALVHARPGRALRGRVVRAAIVVVPSALGLGPWLIRAVHLEGPQGVRRIATYGALGGSLRAAVETVASWAVPVGQGRWHTLVSALLLLLLLAVGPVLWARARACGELLSVLMVTALVYTGFVLASRVVADPNISFDERILAPLLMLAELAMGLLLAAGWPSRSRFATAITAILVVGWVAASAGESAARIVQAREDGGDFAGSDWRDSPTVAWVRSPAGGMAHTLYTNWPAAVYFQADRAAHYLPTSLDALTLRRFRERLPRMHGVVVGFLIPSPDGAPPDSIAHLLGLRAIARFEDGTVWQEPEGPQNAELK